MPLPLHEDRRGTVYFICPGQNAYQQTPAGLTEGQVAPWFAPQNMVFTFIPHYFGTFQPFEPRYGEYTYNMGMGPSEQGFKPYSTEIVQPFVQADSLAKWIDPWHALLPDGPYFEQSSLELIPEDAWITEVWWSLYYVSLPLNWEYAVHSMTHTNTLLPQPVTFPGTTLVPYEYNPLFGWTPEEEILEVTPGTINARDAILQDFSMSTVFRHETGTDEAGDVPSLNIAYILMVASWEGIEALNVTQWDDVTCAFGMTAAADLAVMRNIAADLSFLLDMDATDLKTIANMDGSMDADMDGISDPTKDVGGIETGTDTTGWFLGNMALTDDTLVGHFRLDADQECVMSMSLAGDMDRSTNMAGTMPMAAEKILLGAQLLKEGTLWVEEDSLAMSVSLSAGMAQTLAMVGAMSCSMSLTSTLNTTTQLSATLPAGMSLDTSYLGRFIDIAAAPAFSMVSSGIIARQIDISATMGAELSFWAGITYEVRSDALPENTIYLSARDREVHAEPKGRTLYVNPKDRTVYIGQRDRTLYLDSQQGN